MVDSNILAYLLLPGEFTARAEWLFTSDPDWIAPDLWRSEFRNILAGYMRRGLLNLEQASVLQTAHARKIKSPQQLLQLVLLYCGLVLSQRSCAGEIAQLQGYLSDGRKKDCKPACHGSPPQTVAANLAPWPIARFASSSAATSAPPIKCTVLPMVSSAACNSRCGS